MTGTDAPSTDGAAVDSQPDERVEVAELDAVAAAAVDLAREAAESEAPGLVGEHLGVDADAERVVTHYFATRDPGYVGWRWAVTLARASRSKTATVDDVVLLPGAEALLAPQWLPWSERLRPGDMGAGDLLPTAPDDPRLIAAYFATEDADESAIAYEVGLGRERLLSYEGLLEAVDRWHSGDAGPRAEAARAATANCATCGFFVPLAGGLRQAFGACANAFAPDDGKVVAVDHGCGAHSEALVAAPVSPEQAQPVFDDAGYELIDPAAIVEEPEPTIVDEAPMDVVVGVLAVDEVPADDAPVDEVVADELVSADSVVEPEVVVSVELDQVEAEIDAEVVAGDDA